MIPQYESTGLMVDVIVIYDPNSPDVRMSDGCLEHLPDQTDEERLARATRWHVIGLQDMAHDDGIEEGAEEWPTAPNPDTTVEVWTLPICTFPFPMVPRTTTTGPCK